MNLDALFTPKSDAEPSGPNLEYDSVFIEMEIAAQPGEEKQAGNEILAAAEPDFAEVAAKSMAVMEQSHDLRAGVNYAWAVLNTKGILAFGDATGYIRGILERFWDTCHPQLDADDDNDPTMRISAVTGLGGRDTVFKSLTRAPVARSRTFGELNLRDMQTAHGEIPAAAGSTPKDKGTLRATFESSDADWVAATLTAARTSLANLKAINAIFNKQTPANGPDLDDMIKAVQSIVRLMAEYVQEDQAGSAQPEDDQVPDMAADEAPRPRQSSTSRAANAPGTIASRSDVTATLDAIMAYYRENEPSSPLPIILARARRLVNADFMEILKDLAPSGVDDFNKVGGLEPS